MGLSFYGGGAFGGGSGSGSTNYDSMVNAPIKNLTGTPTNPVSLQGLAYGRYNITGDFKHTDISSPIINNESIQVIVCTDKATQQKVAYYTFVKDKELITALVTFTGNNVADYKEIKHSQIDDNNDYWEEF